MAPRESLISCMSVSHIQVLYSTKPMSSGVSVLTLFCSVFLFCNVRVFFINENIHLSEISLLYVYTCTQNYILLITEGLMTAVLDFLKCSLNQQVYFYNIKHYDLVSYN